MEEATRAALAGRVAAMDGPEPRKDVLRGEAHGTVKAVAGV